MDQALESALVGEHERETKNQHANPMKYLLALIAAVAIIASMGLCAVTLVGLLATRHTDPGTSAVATAILLLLPSLGLAGLLGSHRAGLLLASLGWPLLVLSGLPLFFPGERAEAMASGLVILSLPFHEPISPAKSEELALWLDGLLPSPSSTQPLPRAEPLPEKLLPPSTIPMAEDQVALPYEGQGNSLSIPVSLQGATGDDMDVFMLLDTGSTFTTLDRSTIQALGYRLAPDAPIITTSTAKGDSDTSILILDRLWLGGFQVDGVTVAVCDPCADDDGQAGLLGLNVTGRFMLHLDTARRELVLEPRPPGTPTTLDIKPWIEISGRSTHWPDGRTEFLIHGENLGDRQITNARVAIRCSSRTFIAELPPIPPRELVSTSLSVPRTASCESVELALEQASW